MSWLWQVSLCFACKIGGTFSSRVSEQCMSACRLHDCETHRTRIVNTIRRGLAKHTSSDIILLHPSGALPHLPYFLLTQKAVEDLRLLTPSTPATC